MCFFAHNEPATLGLKLKHISKRGPCYVTIDRHLHDKQSTFACEADT